MSFPFRWLQKGYSEHRLNHSRRREFLRFPYRDQNRLEVLARPPPRAAVDMALEPIDEAQPTAIENLGIELAPIVDDDDDRCSGLQHLCATSKHVGDPTDVRIERRPARPPSRGAELALAPVVEPEQLVRVAVLLVVVDEARVRG